MKQVLLSLMTLVTLALVVIFSGVVILQRVNKASQTKSAETELKANQPIVNTVDIEKQPQGITEGTKKKQTVTVLFDVKSSSKYPATSECDKTAVSTLKKYIAVLNKAFEKAVECQNDQLNQQSNCLVNCTQLYSDSSYSCKSTYDQCTNKCIQNGEEGCSLECLNNFTACGDTSFAERSNCEVHCFDFYKPLNCSWKEIDIADKDLKTLFDNSCY